MCYLIHVGVPSWYESSVEAPREFHVERHHNASVEAAIGSEFALFSISDGGCSCAMYVAPRHRGTEDRRADRMRKKYGRLGWSEAKVQRALTAATEARARNTRPPGLRVDVSEYIADLADVVLEVRLIVHDYRGPFSEEHVSSGAPKSVQASDVREGLIFNVDTVYTVRV